MDLSDLGTGLQSRRGWLVGHDGRNQQWVFSRQKKTKGEARTFVKDMVTNLVLIEIYPQGLDTSRSGG